MAEMSNKKSTATNVNGGTPSTTKPKKSKTDLIRAAVGNYLKQKNYVGTDKYRKSDLQLQQSKKQFVISKLLESDMHAGNFFTYSNAVCLTNNPHIVDQQFNKFSQFVEAQSDSLRQELRRFYGPLLCHLYLDLIKAREAKAAGEFLKKYAYLVAPVDVAYDAAHTNPTTSTAPIIAKINGCAVTTNDIHADGHLTIARSPQCNNSSGGVHFVVDANGRSTGEPELDYFMRLMQILSQCTRLEMLEHEPDLCHFVSSKYEIHTTEAVLDALGSYMEARGHVLILNTLYTWVHVQVIDNELRKWTEDKLFLAGSTETEGQDDEDGDGEDDDSSSMDKSTKKFQLPGGGGGGGSRGLSGGLKRSASAALDERKSALGCDEGEEAIGGRLKTENGWTAEMQETLRKRSSNVRTCLQAMSESRDQILKSQSQFPRFIKLADKNRGLTSADIDANQCHLVAGFNSSVVQLWQMNQLSCRGKNLYRRFEDSLCCWELNNCFKEEEDPIESDIKTHAHMSLDRRKRKYEEKKYEDNSINAYGGIQLRGHSLGVTDVRFSRHYPLIYSVSKDHTMRSWRANNYTCAAIYRGHSYPVWCIDESPSGLYTATGSKDLTARLWSLEREFPYITYVGHTQDVECIAFHPNGNYIATGSADLSVRLWCVTSGKLMRVFTDCKQAVTCVSFSPDGKMLAAGGDETKVRIFDLAGGQQLHELKDHSAPVTDIAWSETASASGGRHLASVCRDGSLRLWDVKRLQATHEGSSATATAISSSGSSSSNCTASSSTTTTTLPASPNRLTALSSKCERLVKVFISRNGTISCVGS